MAKELMTLGSAEETCSEGVLYRHRLHASGPSYYCLQDVYSSLMSTRCHTFLFSRASHSSSQLEISSVTNVGTTHALSLPFAVRSIS